MKAPYIEGIANHDDPESCAAVRKDCREALTGARAGRVLSRENGTAAVVANDRLTQQWVEQHSSKCLTDTHEMPTALQAVARHRSTDSRPRRER